MTAPAPPQILAYCDYRNQDVWGRLNLVHNRLSSHEMLTPIADGGTLAAIMIKHSRAVRLQLSKANLMVAHRSALPRPAGIGLPSGIDAAVTAKAAQPGQPT